MSEYNGYTNWETWNAYLWLSNNYSVYQKARGAANEFDPEHFADYADMLLTVDCGNPDRINTELVNYAELQDALQDE